MSDTEAAIAELDRQIAEASARLTEARAEAEANTSAFALETAACIESRIDGLLERRYALVMERAASYGAF